MKRFYRTASCRAFNGRFAIELDGKPVKTPGGNTLEAPNERIAGAVVREWALQKETIVPDSMPLTALLATARDSADRPALEKAVVAYMDTDLLCYRAPQPAAIAQKQAAAWDPWLAWFGRRYGVRLAVTDGLAALKQPEAAREKAAAAVRAMGDLEFTILQTAVSSTGSFVLGLAFLAREADAGQLLAAAHVEETHKAAIYREDIHGAAPDAQARQDRIRRDLDAAETLLSLISS